MTSEPRAASSEQEYEPAARRSRLAARFGPKGVFWRQFLHHAVTHVPGWIEPAVIATWSAIFLLWGPGRRGVMRNLAAIKPGSSAIGNFFRCFRVFCNYAYTITDNVRFKELRTIPDWEFSGYQYFETLQASGGAILLTAHMGSYDLGAYLFAERSAHRIVMVRAPEVDPQTHEFEKKHRAQGLQVEFNVNAADLAIDLLHAIRDGAIVAIQGDRVTPGIADLPTTLFGKPARLPAGPFALAMASRAPIHPIFVMRVGWRRYRVVAFPPIVVPASRDRDSALAAALETWTRNLEDVARRWWFQWFMFEPFSPEPGQ